MEMPATKSTPNAYGGPLLQHSPLRRSLLFGCDDFPDFRHSRRTHRRCQVNFPLQPIKAIRARGDVLLDSPHFNFGKLSQGVAFDQFH
jgi:hypothetical protein